MFLVPPPFMKTGNPTMFAAIQQAGLTGNLRLCLDAGDAASYTSGQSWLDTSGNGYDFFLGANGSAGADDPTFNGSAGKRSASEYFSFDGGDYLTYDAANETWMQNLHKDNALLTVVFWVYPGSIGSVMGLLGTNGQDLTKVGVSLSFTAAGALQFVCANGSGVAALTQGSGGAANMNAAAWNFCAVSCNEAISELRWRINSYTMTHSVNYSSPSASNASYTMQTGSRGNNSSPLVSGSRIAEVGVWEGVALSDSQVDAIYSATRGRFGV